MNNFDIITLIGSGSFSNVYKVKRKIDGCIYAMKKVNIANLSEKEIANTLNEIRILSSITHNNIIAYKEAFYSQNENCLCLVMEYINDRDLEKKILSYFKSRTHFAEGEIWLIFSQIISAVSHLHLNKIIHRDIKSANIFIDKSLNIKLGDMNVAKIANDSELMKTKTGTPYYASPEIWKDMSYDYKSDIWSLGVVLYEMAALHLPFCGKSYNEVYKKICNGTFAPLPKMYSATMTMMVRWMLKVDKDKRPSIEEIKNKMIKIGIYKREDTSNIANIHVKMMSTLKMPVKYSEVNMILPKAKYHNKRNVQSAGNKPQAKKEEINKKRKKLVPLFLRGNINNNNNSIKQNMQIHLNHHKLPTIKQEIPSLYYDNSPNSTSIKNTNNNSMSVESLHISTVEAVLNIEMLRRKKLKLNKELILPQIPERLNNKANFCKYNY